LADGVDDADKGFRKKIAKNLVERLFVPGAANVPDLTQKDAKIFYTNCIYDAMDQNLNEYCSLFTDEELLEFEFFQDVSKYYSTGYGFDLSWKISCDLLADIIDSMEGVAQRDPKYALEVANLRFAHAETILPLLSYLELFKDEKNIFLNAKEAKTQRKLRTVNMTPFSGNVLFAFYECPPDDQPQFKVKLIVNERETPIPACQNDKNNKEDLYCPFERFSTLFHEATSNSCNFEQLCASLTPGNQDANLSDQQQAIV